MEISATTADEPTQDSSATRPRILVADDSRVMRLAISKILGTDYDVLQAEHGAAAWDLLQADPSIQALLTDIQMPNMDGYELICRIRAAEEGRLRDLPVMTITGSEDDAIKQQALACGATDFVIKPLDAVQLRARVQAYVRYDQNARAMTEKSQALEGQAITDPHTGLRSRRYLMQRGEQDIAYAQRHAQDLALLRIDIDAFKKIYRAHGDEMVDRLIAWLAKLLFSTARTEDTVARVSGAEFAVLATNIELTKAKALASRIMTNVGSQPFANGNVSIPISLSIGIASLGADRCETIEALYSLAHQRLCHAVSEGGSRVCTSVMDEDGTTIEEVTLEAVDGRTANVAQPDDISSNSTPAETTSREATVSRRAESVPVSSAPETVPADDEIVIETADTSAVATTPNLPDAGSPPAGLMSVDKALAMISLGKGRSLLPYMELLMQEIQPLIDFYQNLKKSERRD